MKCTYEGVKYRTMPLEQLNSNIPIRRVMIKWMAFKTIPDQYKITSKVTGRHLNFDDCNRSSNHTINCI